ncbi:PfkB family carbohydrate kinase [Vibrio hannami]|uniref:PfkB family carbohydrate kinase n=1 Tax=Vibrio hannami TaxID=2717094 RepID=UPI00241081E5|nr:PfkB family carbohydrate kinase [Vibrio hannami]MDG3088428.1 PfkB family carbohydrate kinase [Vibrio hannami]
MFITEREQEILNFLKQDPLIPQQELADKLELSRSAVAVHIMNLTRKGFIKGKGYILSPEQYALVIGGANMDLCGKADKPLIDGDSNPGKLTSSAGGVGRNIAENQSRLGSTVQFIGAIGDDQWGVQLKQACVNAGVGVDHCLTVSGATTSSYLSIHDSNGEMKLALNDMELINSLTPEKLERKEGVISRASMLVLDANLSEEALDYLFSVYGDKPIFVDPVSTIKAQKLLPYLDRIHTLKPNLAEAELLTGHKIESEEDLPDVARQIHEKGVKNVLISLGSKGAYSSDGVTQEFIPPGETQVNNVTGAGDALMAGLAHGFMRQWNWENSVNFSLAAAKLALVADKTINLSMSEQAVLNYIEQKTV